MGEEIVNQLPVLSVSEVCAQINSLLQEKFYSAAIRGEISEFIEYRTSGHWYFSIKDSAAQIRCVMFARDNASVSFIPKVGDAVKVRGRMVVYPKSGSLQCVVSSICHAGEGALYEQFVQLRKKLTQEGVFDEEIKRPCPRVPLRIGVVTGLQTSALRDVLSTLLRRAPYADVIVYPTRVQGRGAHLEIASAIQLASKRSEVDVLLLVRGGGSIEDLWSFNEEEVARAIRSSVIPVICGVGHESDVTIADLASDYRAATPTAAAESAAPRREDLMDSWQALMSNIHRSLKSHIDTQSQNVDWLSRTFANPNSVLDSYHLKIRQLMMTIQLIANSNLSDKVIQTHRRAVNIIHAKPQLDFQLVRQYSGWMESLLAQRLMNSEVLLTRAKTSLEAMDPSKVLERGYALVTNMKGQPLTAIKQIHKEDVLRIYLADGTLDTRVETIHEQ